MSSPVVTPSRHRPAGMAGPSGPAGRRPRAGRRQRPAAVTVEELARAFVGLFLEVEAGRRPRAQLRPLMTPMLYARLSQVWFKDGPMGTVHTVRALSGDAGSRDVVAIVRRGRRWGAVGLRLVHARDRWLVDALARPEDGRLPPPAYPVPPEDPGHGEEEIPAVLTAGAGAAGGGDWPHGG